MEANRSDRLRWTYEEYARLPISGSTRYEVIDGEVAVTPSPSSTHQRVVGNAASSSSVTDTSGCTTTGSSTWTRAPASGGGSAQGHRRRRSSALSSLSAGRRCGEDRRSRRLSKRSWAGDA